MQHHLSLAQQLLVLFISLMQYSRSLKTALSPIRSRLFSMSSYVSSSSPDASSLGENVRSIDTVIHLLPSLLEAQTAKQFLYHPQVKFIDGSWHLGGVRNPRQEFLDQRIQGAQYFDIEEISDKSINLPHMIPSEELFATSVANLGISSTDHVIVYTVSDAFSAARVWWMFRLFGHQRVSILHGGLNAWKSIEGPLESGPVIVPAKGNFVAKLNRKMVVNADEVLEVVNTGSSQILDARSTGRFLGKAPEPRPGLEGGHIPGSLSLPFSALLKEGDFTSFKPSTEIRDALVNSGVIMGSRVVLTCGSGVTAAVLCFGFHLLGKDLESFPIYDGSWSEWGSRADLPKINPSKESNN